MKKHLSVQLYAGTKNTGIEHSPFPGLNNELFYSVASDGLSKPIWFQDLVNSFTGNNLLNKFLTLAKNPLSVTEIANLNRKNPVKKINGDEVVLHPLFNAFLKEAAPHLSNIEMAVDNYDLSCLYFDTIALKALLFKIRMPTTYRLIEQMEIDAKENRLKEVNDSLLALKKIIAQIVQYMQMVKD